MEGSEVEEDVAEVVVEVLMVCVVGAEGEAAGMGKVSWIGRGRGSGGWGKGTSGRGRGKL